jgi:hypothetical protein
MRNQFAGRKQSDYVQKAQDTKRLTCHPTICGSLLYVVVRYILENSKNPAYSFKKPLAGICKRVRNKLVENNKSMKRKYDAGTTRVFKPKLRDMLYIEKIMQFFLKRVFTVI